MEIKYTSPQGPGTIYTCYEPDQALAAVADRWQEQRVFVVTEGNLAGLHSLPMTLRGFPCLILPGGGEALKTQAFLNIILSWLARHRASRRDWLVAVGGGALTDVAGLAACLYKRGMPLVTIPTTLLAQVDGSLGGKNAINAFGQKNSLGSFWFPRAVICAAKYLKTLPRRQFNSGLGEVWKYRLLFPETDWLQLKPLASRDVTHQLISRAIVYKCQVVEADPLDQGGRHRLNLGHTLAHALEGVLPIFHGEAVLWGLEFALMAAVTRGHCPQEEGLSALRALAGQPRPRLPRLAFSQLWPFLQGDKKNTDLTKITLVLPAPGGQVTARDFSRRELEECWRLMQQKP